MRSTLFAAFLALGLVAPLRAQTLAVEDVTGDLLDGQPQILITLDGNVPAALEPQALDPASYGVVASAPVRAGDVVPALEGTAIPVSRVTFEVTQTGTDRSVLVLHLSGFTHGEGKVQVRAMAAGDATIEEATETWSISVPYETRPTLVHDQSLRFSGETPVVDFSLTYGGFEWKTEGSPYRITATLEGSAPLGTPADVEETPGADSDASEEVADFLKLSVLYSRYRGGGFLQSIGLVARSTAQTEGLEAVGTYQVASLFGDNRIFAAAEAEAGYREGDAEWTSLTEPAPDRGNVVARLGAVVEWGPRLGPINRDLGAGLRFFVRGRGWADWADDEEGEGDVRLRGFVDAELFYNVSDDYRLFLRHEEGYVPPDLSQRHSETFVGVGTSF
jgi:hypothetical protein